MKKLLVALAISIPLFVGMIGGAAAADRPVRERGEPVWVTGGNPTIPPKNACGGGPFGGEREYGRPQPGR